MYDLRKRLTIWLVAIGLLLLIPFLAMQFTEEVNWGLSDFIVMGIALIAIALLYELVARRSNTTAYRAAFGIALLGAFLLLWVNGAVGIIGSENQPANLLYGAVLVVGLAGSLIARLKPAGMSRTLFAAALVQLLVPLAALILWPPPATSWSPSIPGVFLLSAFFALLFVLSALLFRQAITPPREGG